MNERQLLALKYVIQHGSVNKAAELLHVTQSAVSQMITNLEQDLGFPVFERRQGKVATATPQGRRFLPEAETVLQSIDKARRAAYELKDMSIGNFRITSSSGLAASLMPKPLARFSKNHPEIATSLQTHHSREVRELVASRIFDVGVCELFEPTPPTDDLAVFTMNLALICHRDDPLVHLPVISPRDLRERTVITPYDHHPTTIGLRKAFHKQGAVWRSHIASNSTTAACQMVALGDAVTWTDPFTLRMLSNPLLQVRPFEPEISLNFAVLKAPREREAPEASEIVTLIREEIEAVCG
jgi:DNA-binding transcriptional LysR family regulator